ncbi:thiolase family protein [Natronosalvus amylolyticus]|uniref:thiolase family protein n=1 Tax=Natronosalvus amylolyticus TaxID=2961994 RepID=UPI0020C93BBC|nr:thiolase family protein [Natronosalvus amylolyticus]
MSRVAIAGHGTYGFGSDTNGRSDTEMVLEASMAALESANLSHEEVDSIIYTGQDAYDGSAISDGQRVSAAGGYRKPFMRIQNGGGAAIHQAVAKINSGKADVVSIVAADSVYADPRVLSWTSHEALYHRTIGQNNDQSFGLLATVHQEERGVSDETLAQVAEKNYRAAANNDVAHRQEAYSVEDVLEADRVVGPLTELMLRPNSFGAAVCVLVSESFAEERGNARSWITGTGLATGKYWYRDMSGRLEQPTLQQAASTAFEEADVTIDDVDAAEIAAYSPTLEMTSYEAIGLCAEGESSSLIEDGVTAPNGSFPVNLSGGPLATSPPNAGGIYRAIAASQVIEGDLGDGSAERVLLADNDMHLGEPGRTDAVMVLEGGAA